MDSFLLCVKIYIFLACDLKCETCSNLNVCTSCDHPYFLHKNECVDDCGAGFYSDFETRSCKGL